MTFVCELGLNDICTMKVKTLISPGDNEISNTAYKLCRQTVRRLFESGKWCTVVTVPFQGRLEHNNDDVSYYDGEWVDNIRQGFGTRRYPSGNIYEGMWYKNRRHGLGTMHWFDRNQSYSGNWEDGVQVTINVIACCVIVNMFLLDCLSHEVELFVDFINYNF